MIETFADLFPALDKLIIAAANGAGPKVSATNRRLWLSAYRSLMQAKAQCQEAAEKYTQKK